MNEAARATIVTEASRRPGDTAVLIGWLIRRGDGPASHTPLCERCSKTCGPAADRRTAEATLRKHRLKCRPPVLHGRIGDPLTIALERAKI